MKRERLIGLMSTVEPALSASAFVPVLSHFWFTGKRLMAYNDHIAISVKCETDFVGAVPKTLLALLATSKAEEVEMNVSGKSLNIKAVSSKFKLAIMGEEDFIFKMPKMRSTEPVGVDAGRFFQALESCMFSVGNDTSHADHLGVTLIEERGKLLMFSTDRATISHGELKLEGTLGIKRVILPSDFCRQMLRIVKGASTIKLEITDEYVLCRHGSVTIYGKLVEPDHPLNFKGVLEQELTFDKAAMADIPEKLQAVLERACIVTDSAIDKSRTEITVSVGGRAHFYSKSERGEVNDTILVDKKHPEVKVRVDPHRMKDGYGRFDKMYITNNAVVMMREAMVYLISATRV